MSIVMDTVSEWVNAIYVHLNCGFFFCWSKNDTAAFPVDGGDLLGSLSL